MPKTTTIVSTELLRIAIDIFYLFILVSLLLNAPLIILQTTFIEPIFQLPISYKKSPKSLKLFKASYHFFRSSSKHGKELD